MSGRKHDKEKTRLDLIAPDALEALGRVLTYGARKYDPRNWERGMAWSRVIGACLRHVNAINAGEDLDRESGLPHASHLMCDAMFLAAYYLRGIGIDDRNRIVGQTVRLLSDPGADPEITIEEEIK